MKKLIAVSVFSVLGLTSVNSYANCALAAVKNAPSLPSLEASQSADVAALKLEVETYLDHASQRLEACGGYSEDFIYNVALTRLEQTAEQYNALVRRHNQMLVSAK
ncbi:MAG: hypothetical protein P1U47_03025 [Zhongshania sp.]|uniref:hypothetical protein n=1 Tax=Zhongshania sp. TaxID=1971902 RepID=UPI0026110210|nr:hypothetical protein [Zhongshania sp.]MDF1691319.1 hypothetical protein [Zhongshania sp.]